jgi:hypothetical protein
MTTTTGPKMVEVFYTNADGKPRTWIIRRATEADVTMAIDPPVTLTRDVLAFARELEERAPRLGWTNFMIVEFQEDKR